MTAEQKAVIITLHEDAQRKAEQLSDMIKDGSPEDEIDTAQAAWEAAELTLADYRKTIRLNK